MTSILKTPWDYYLHQLLTVCPTEQHHLCLHHLLSALHWCGGDDEMVHPVMGEG